MFRVRVCGLGLRGIYKSLITSQAVPGPVLGLWGLGSRAQGVGLGSRN